MLYAFLQETHTHTNPSCSSLDASYMQIAKWCSFFDVAQSRILDVFYITAREGRKEESKRITVPLFPFARLHFYLFKSVSSNWKPVCFFLSLPSLFSTFYAFLHFTLSLSFFFPSLLNPRRLRCCLRENVGHLFSAIPLTPTRRRRWK